MRFSKILNTVVKVISYLSQNPCELGQEEVVQEQPHSYTAAIVLVQAGYKDVRGAEECCYHVTYLKHEVTDLL